MSCHSISGRISTGADGAGALGQHHARPHRLGQFSKVAQPLLSSQTQQGVNSLMQVANNTQVPGLATDFFTDTMQGKYLQSNPFQGEVVQAAMRPMVDQFRESVAPGIAARFAAAGRSGSPSEYASAYRAEDALAKNLGEIGAQIGYQDYARERGFQNDMLGQAGNILALQAAPAQMQLEAGGILDAFRDKQNAMAAGQVQDQFNLSRVNAKVNAAQQLLRSEALDRSRPSLAPRAAALACHDLMQQLKVI